jgi:hypothetical protein
MNRRYFVSRSVAFAATALTFASIAEDLHPVPGHPPGRSEWL